MIRQRISKLLTEMNRGIYEKETEISLSLLAALAGESIILLGPPGVAKSMVARRLKEAFCEARSFEYLMSRFSTPDEIFGPVSISKLKSSDSYVRAVDGYLPTADVVFLDEIWKAGPAIQNTLLTVINEKLFRNGNTEMHLPLKLLVAASNELPTQGEGLEALWDRFIVRLECRNIKSEKNFDAMLLSDTCLQYNVNDDLKIKSDEYATWQNEIDGISVSPAVLNAIHSIRRAIRAVAIEGTNEHRDVYVSDRRWKNIIRLMRTSAFMHDRSEVAIGDLLPIYHCLWQEPEERNEIRNIIIRILFADVADSLHKLQNYLKEDISIYQVTKIKKKALQQQKRDADKKLYNNFYYHLLGCDAEHTFIFSQDYRQLPFYGESAQQGVMYTDRRNPNAIVIRSYDGASAAPIGSRPVALARDNNHLYIDGVSFLVETTDSVGDQQLSFTNETNSVRDYTAEIEVLADQIAKLENDILDNMFLAQDDRTELASHIATLRKSIAFTRQDIEKLYD